MCRKLGYPALKPKPSFYDFKTTMKSDDEGVERSLRVQPSTAVRFVSMDQCMAKLRDSVVEKIVRDNRTTSLLADRTDQLRKITEHRVMTMITDFHTPVHPTYAFMINRAITELSTDGGPDKESISNFIRMEFDDLPLAHERLLTLQLVKLREKGEIVSSELGCYTLPVGDHDQEKQNGEEQAEKKGGEGCHVKGGNFLANEAVDEQHIVNVSSNDMKCKKQNGKGGLRPGRRWSRRLQPNKPQEDEANELCNEVVEVLAQTGGEIDANRDRRSHTELSVLDHGLEEQLSGIFGEPLEPPGFPSQRDQLIKLKQQAQADLQAAQQDLRAEKILHAEKDGMNADTILKIRTILELSPTREEDAARLIQSQGLEPCTDDVYVSDQSALKPILPMVQQDQLTLSTEVVTMLTKAAPDSCSPALLTWLPDDDQHPEKQKILIRRGRGRPRKITPQDGSIITEKPKKKQGRGRPRKLKPDGLPEAKASIEVETVADNEIVIWDSWEQRQPKTADMESPDQEQNSERGGPETRPVCKTMKKKKAAPWDWEVVATRVPEQNSNSGNNKTLATESASQDKEGTNKRKRIGRPPNIDNDQHSEGKDSPKVKRCGGKGRKSIYYADISITDLVYSQDHHVQVQPMSRFRGRPRKL